MNEHFGARFYRHRRRKKPFVGYTPLVRMAIANLQYKKMRNGLTILGIAIGTGSIFMLMSFGLGLQSLVEQQITDGKSINTIDVTATGSRLLKIDQQVIKDISSLAHVKAASGVYAKASKITVGGASADVVAYGVDDVYLQTSSLIMKAGNQLDTQERNTVNVSNSILEAIGVHNAKDAIGDNVVLKIQKGNGEYYEKKLSITGVTSGGNGLEVFTSSGNFQDAGVNTFTQAKVIVEDRDYVNEVRRSIESLGYDTVSPLDTIKQVDQFFKIFRVILISFGCIGMIIAVLGMINTLTISLIERTREVALMLAIGARPPDIQKLFIIEAIVMSLSGGLVGLIFAISTSKLIDVSLNQLAKNRGASSEFSVFATPIWLIALTLLFMISIGMLVAFMPARRASKTNSIDALRNE